jgi:hypothetical protein
VKTPKPATPEQAVAEAAIVSALAKRDFRSAVKFVPAKPAVSGALASFFAGHSEETQVAHLQAIYGHVPGILRGIAPEALETLRTAAALTYLFGAGKPLRRWLPRDFATGTRFTGDVASRMMRFYASHRAQLDEWAQAPVSAPYRMVAKVRALGAGHSCPACLAIRGRMYSLAAAPELPHPECTSPNGCRCMYSMSVER